MQLPYEQVDELQLAVETLVSGRVSVESTLVLEVELDGGACPDPQTVDYFGNEGPTRVADCRPGEMEVPNVVSLRLGKALKELRRQKLRAQVVWKPAGANESVGRVLSQIPSAGTLAAGEQVTIVLARKLSATAAGSETASP